MDKGLNVMMNEVLTHNRDCIQTCTCTQKFGFLCAVTNYELRLPGAALRGTGRACEDHKNMSASQAPVDPAGPSRLLSQLPTDFRHLRVTRHLLNSLAVSRVQAPCRHLIPGGL